MSIIDGTPCNGWVCSIIVEYDDRAAAGFESLTAAWCVCVLSQLVQHALLVLDVFSETTQLLLVGLLQLLVLLHTRTHASMHAHTHTRTHAHMHVCTHAFARTHIYTHAHTHACKHACTRTHANTHAHARMQTHMHTHACTHTYKPTKTPTHTHRRT